MTDPSDQIADAVAALQQAAVASAAAMEPVIHAFGQALNQHNQAMKTFFGHLTEGSMPIPPTHRPDHILQTPIELWFVDEPNSFRYLVALADALAASAGYLGAPKLERASVYTPSQLAMLARAGLPCHIWQSDAWNHECLDYDLRGTVAFIPHAAEIHHRWPGDGDPLPPTPRSALGNELTWPQRGVWLRLEGTPEWKLYRAMP